MLKLALYRPAQFSFYKPINSAFEKRKLMQPFLSEVDLSSAILDH